MSIWFDFFAGKSKIESNKTVVDTATYELNGTDGILHVTYTATGAVTIALPSSQCINSRPFITIKDAGGNANTNNITLETEGSEKIDGADTLSLQTDNGSFRLYPYNSNWFTF